MIIGNVSMQQTWCYGECSWRLSATEEPGHCPAHEGQVVWNGGNWSGLSESSDKVSVNLGTQATAGMLCFYVTDSAPAVTLFVGSTPYEQSRQEVAAGCAANAPVKPRAIALGCLGTKFKAERIKFRSYGGDTATATAFIGRKNCQSSCATEPATITLSDPRSNGDGAIYYTTLSWKFAGKPLHGLPRSGQRTITISS
jgi:hypothetical protein